jgi:integrase
VNTKSEISPKQRRYQKGSLVPERRKECSHGRTTRCPHCVWAYRFFEYIDGKKIRRKKILGTVEEFPTKDDAKRASEHLRMSANAENPRSNVTMRGLINLYTEKVLRSCLNVPIGAVQNPNARMGYECAENYSKLLRNWITPRWNDYLVSAFERPEIWSAAEEWLDDLLRSPENPGGLAPKTVRHIFVAMGQVMRYAVKWGYLSQNPFGGRGGPQRRIDPPRGSTLRLTRAAQLTPEQSFELALHLALRERTAVAFAASLGPRGSETFALKWNDLDLTEGVVTFRRGLVRGRITLGKNAASNTEMPLPRKVVQLLREWRSATPYNKPDDWLFASSHRHGKMPLDRGGLMQNHIQPIARKLGLPHVTWYSFRHSLSAWGKECLTAEERKVLLRHATIPSGEGYGEIPLEKKHAIAQRLWTHVGLDEQQSLGGAVTVSSDPPEDNLPTLPLEPSQSPMLRPSAPAFGEGTALPALGGQDAALALQTIKHEKRSAGGAQGHG